jgi:hypothetical protein
VSWWRGLAVGVRWLLALLALFVALYLFGFLVFGCGTDTGSSPQDESAPRTGIDFAG